MAQVLYSMRKEFQSEINNKNCRIKKRLFHYEYDIIKRHS